MLLKIYAGKKKKEKKRRKNKKKGKTKFLPEEKKDTRTPVIVVFPSTLKILSVARVV